MSSETFLGLTHNLGACTRGISNCGQTEAEQRMGGGKSVHTLLFLLTSDDPTHAVVQTEQVAVNEVSVRLVSYQENN